MKKHPDSENRVHSTRKFAEQENLRLDSIIESSDDAIIGKTLDGIITSWNRGAEKMYGYSKEEAIHQPISFIIPPDRQNEMKDIQKKIRNGQHIDHFETVRQRKDGTCINVSVSVSPIIDRDNNIIGASTIARDITERTRMELLLRESEERFAKFMENLPAVIFIKDRESRLLYANPELKNLFGWHQGVGKLTSELLPPEIAKKMIADDQRVIEKGSETIHEKIIDVNGHEHFFETHKFPFSRENGEVLIGGISIDETEHRRAEQALRESEDQFRLLLNSTAEAIYGIDLNGECTFCNNACLEILGFKHPSELLGKNMHWQIHSKRADGSPFPMEECRIFRAFQKGENAHVDDEVLWRADGTCYPAEYWSYPERRDGKIIGSVVTFLDITQRKQVEETVRMNEARLKSLLKISEFNVTSRHELLDFALEEAIALTQSKIGYIYFYSEEKQEFTLNTWSKDVMKECTIAEPQRVYQLEKTGIWGEAVRQKKAIIVNDFPAPNPLKKGYPEGHASLLKYLTVPIISVGKIVAVVGVANKETDYTDEDVQQLTLMMNNVWQISERKRIEEEVRKLSRAVEQSPASIVITDTNGAIEYVNPKFVQLTGYSFQEVLGQNPRVLKSGEKPSEDYRRMWQTITSGNEWHGEFHNKKKNGELYWELAVISPITDERGTITHYVAVKEDVTQRKQAEEEREKLITDLREALAQIKTLSGLIPICSVCKKIRDDRGYWNILEAYLLKHSSATFSHSVCPDCAAKLYPEYLPRAPKQP